MKKRWKILGIMAAVIVVIGLFGVIAARTLGITFYHVAEEMDIIDDEMIPQNGEMTQSTALTEQEFSDIHSLSATIGGCEVLIKTHAEDKVRIDTSSLNYEQNNLELQVTETDGTLKIETIKNGNVFDIFGESLQMRGTLLIYVPQKTFKSVELSLGGSDATVAGLESGRINIMVNGSECDMHSIITNDLYAEVGGGDLEFEGRIKENATIQCGAGEVDMDLLGRQNDYNYKVECGAGDVEIGEREFGGLASKKTVDNGSSRTIDITCGAGDVSLSFQR